MALAQIPAVLPDDNSGEPVPAQRGGFTAGHDGKQAHIGYIDPQVFRDFGPDTSTGKLVALNLQVVDQVAQRLHDLNEDGREAIQRKVDPSTVLPAPNIRQSLLESDEKQVEKFENAIADAEVQHKIDTIGAVPFDTKGYALPEVLRDQELRAAYARMTPQQRRDVRERGNFMRAVLTSEPELSGMSPAEHKMLLQDELRTRRPDLVAKLAADEHVLVALKMTATALRTALANERKALGLTKPPAPTRLAPRKWK